MRHPHSRHAVPDPNEVSEIVVNPVLEHLLHLSVEIVLKEFLDCEIEDRGVKSERVALTEPVTVNRETLRTSSRNQLQSVLLDRCSPGSEARAGMVDEYSGIGLPHDAEKDREWMFNDPPNLVGVLENPRLHLAFSCTA